MGGKRRRREKEKGRKRRQEEDGRRRGQEEKGAEGSIRRMSPSRSPGALARLASQLAAHSARARAAAPAHCWAGGHTAGLHSSAGLQHSTASAAQGPLGAPLGGSEAVALIQGAERGIGLQFVSALGLSLYLYLLACNLEVCVLACRISAH